MELELSEDKKAAQIRELTRLVLSLRDEMHKKHSGFFGSSKKGPDPIPPELSELTDDVSNKKPVVQSAPKDVENRFLFGYELDELYSDLSPLMQHAILLSATFQLEEA